MRRLANDMTRLDGRHRHRPDGKRNIALMAEIRPPDLKLGYETRRYVILRPPVRRALPDESLMSSISTIALSGLNAAARRLDVSASNVANAGSSGALPAADGSVPAGAPRAYDPLQIVQTDVAGG